jgi:hypothetical protein
LLGRTAGVTAIVTAGVLALAAFVQVDTRDAAGIHRDRTVFDVWWTALSRLPGDGPVFLTREVLVVLLLAAVMTLAYVIAATFELAFEDSADNADSG